MAKTSASSTRFRIDALRALDGGERGDAIAQPRRALELQRGGRLRHFPREKIAHRAALAGQEIARLARRAAHSPHALISPVQGAEQRLI